MDTFQWAERSEDSSRVGLQQVYRAADTHGHGFFHRGGEYIFSCVHGSKVAIGEVMFLAAIAVKRGGMGGET